MKQLAIILSAAVLLFSCKKEQELKSLVFPGYSGSGDYATWTLYRHTLSDTVYLSPVLAAQTPATTVKKFDSLLVTYRTKEISPYTIRIYKNGEIGLTQKNAQNIFVWNKQSDLKWEVSGEYIYVYKNVNNVWINIMQGYPDLEKLVFRFKRAYFGDASADKDKFFMDGFFAFHTF